MKLNTRDINVVFFLLLYKVSQYLPSDYQAYIQYVINLIKLSTVLLMIKNYIEKIRRKLRWTTLIIIGT